MPRSPQDLGPIQRYEERRFVNSLITKYWPHLSVAGVAVLAFLVPSINQYVSQHSNTALGVLLATILAAYHMTPPSQKGN
jgi:hypothetical protein